jgi:hypothetical protein
MATDRHQVARGPRVRLDLGAQSLDVDVEGLGVADVVRTPDAVYQLHPGEHPAGVAQQHLQQLELLQRHRHRVAVDRDHVPFDVHPDRAGLDRRRTGQLGLGPAAEHGPDPGHQLAGRVRLGHVVVGAELQPDHLVDLAVLGGQHDHRDLAAGADLPADLGTGQARQHQVEQHQVGAIPVELLQRGGPVVGDRDLVALSAQQVGQRVAERLLVLHYQDPGHGVAPLSSDAASCGRSG